MASAVASTSPVSRTSTSPWLRRSTREELFVSSPVRPQGGCNTWMRTPPISGSGTAAPRQSTCLSMPRSVRVSRSAVKRRLPFDCLPFDQNDVTPKCRARNSNPP